MTKNIAEKETKLWCCSVRSWWKLPASAVFFLWDGQRCFFLKADNGRTLVCRNFVSGGTPDQQKWKRKQPLNKWKLVPKSSSKSPNPDLSYFRWQQSLVPDSQTYPRLWAFYKFGSRGKGCMSQFWLKMSWFPVAGWPGIFLSLVLLQELSDFFPWEEWKWTRKAIIHLHFTLMTPANVRQALAQSQHMVGAARTPFH